MACYGHLATTLQRLQTQELQESNRVLDGVLKKNKAEGVEKLVEHKEAIRKADMQRLDDYIRNVLTEGDAVKLMHYCWLNLTLHFTLHGSEVQIQLKKSDTEFEKGGKGEEYVVLSTDFMSKNCRGGIDGRSFQTCGRMQEEKQVSAMRLLLEKLHSEVKRLFQRALMGKQSLKKPVWFAKMPIGKAVVQDMMPRISIHSDLSVR